MNAPKSLEALKNSFIIQFGLNIMVTMEREEIAFNL